jgi:SAM-dependent methyltransferase
MKTFPKAKPFLTLLMQERKGILRTALHVLIKNKPIEGTVLDLGAGRWTRPRYMDFFDIRKMKTYITLDLVSVGNPNIRADAQQVPLKGNCIQTVLGLNLLEHVPEPELVVAETARVLKKGGQAYFFTPFLTPLHTESPEYAGDFSRLSHASWSYLVGKYFANYTVYPVAFGPFAAMMVYLEYFLPGLVRPLCTYLCIKIDTRLIKSRSYLPGKFLLAVFVVAQK